MKIELLKDCKLTPKGLKKRKGTRLIVHKEFGIKLISEKKAKKVSNSNELNLKNK